MEFNRTSRKAIALLILVFALGVALGAVGHMLAERRVLAQAVQSRVQNGGPGGQQHLVGRLTHDLKLNDDQQKQITQILADMQHSYDTIREQMGPQFDQARNEGRDRIRQVLTPEQRPGFEDFMRKVDEERSRRGPDQYRPSGQRH
jgi:Spy/CpxP family protein refolding chaperone